MDGLEQYTNGWPMDPARDVSAARERVWHAACQAGRCRYAVDNVWDENPPAVDSTNTCGGYHGTRYQDVDGRGVIWRWRPCVRHLAWWSKRKLWLREQKAKQGGKGAPEGYRG